MSRYGRQVALLAAYSFALVAPQLARLGPNVVTKTYLLAAARFWSGLSPYLPPDASDWFKYSPTFALLYGAFLPLGPKAHALGWAALNTTVFWAGVSRWVRLGRGTSPWVWAAVAATSMELDGSLRYQQMNALLVGMTLFALADYARGRAARAGALLALAVDLKILPAPLLAALVLRTEHRGVLVKGAAVALALALLAPALVVGPARDAGLHVEWLHVLHGDATSAGLNDLASSLGVLGWPRSAALAARYLVLAATLALLAAGARAREVSWTSWIPVGLGGILLASPRTEAPTFVLIGATYALSIFALEGSGFRRAGLAAWVLGVALVSLQFNDLWPKALRPPTGLGYPLKAIGTLILWLLAASGVSVSFWARKVAVTRLTG